MDSMKTVRREPEVYSGKDVWTSKAGVIIVKIDR